MIDVMQDEALKKAAAARDDLGADLYNAQQELGRIQAGVQKHQELHLKMKQLREESEQKVEQYKKAHQAQVSKTFVHHHELNAQSPMLSVKRRCG